MEGRGKARGITGCGAKESVVVVLMQFTSIKILMFLQP